MNISFVRNFKFRAHTRVKQERVNEERKKEKRDKQHSKQRERVSIDEKISRNKSAHTRKKLRG